MITLEVFVRDQEDESATIIGHATAIDCRGVAVRGADIESGDSDKLARVAHHHLHQHRHLVFEF